MYNVQCAKFIFVFAVIETAFRLFSGVAFMVGHTPWNETLHKLLPIPTLSSCMYPQHTAPSEKNFLILDLTMTFWLYF